MQPINPTPLPSPDRGQGLNNAIHDAAHLGRALSAHCGTNSNHTSDNGQSLTDALSAYEAEVVERGREAVFSSGENSIMVHDWGQLMESLLFRHGAARGRG